MIYRNRLTSLLAALATVGLAAPQLPAALIGWQGGTGNFISANYSTDGTTQNLLPSAADRINFGAGGTGTLSTGSTYNFQRLYVGGSGNVPNPAAPPANISLPRGGQGTLTVDNGSVLNLTAGAAGSDNAGLTVGRVQNGTLNIDGAGSTVSSSRLIVIGYAGGQPTRSGTINITNGGALISKVGNINIGDAPASGDAGMQGHLFVNGTVTFEDSAADLNIGMRNATSSVTQTGGTISGGDVIEVGASTGAAPNASFTISGGTTSHGGAFFVGRGASTGATVNINGGTINTGGRFLMGAGTATGIVTNHTAGALNALDVRVGDAGTGDTTYYLGGTGVISTGVTGVNHVGRSGVGKLFQTGGTANFNAAFHIGNRETSTNDNDGHYEISGGDANFGANLSIATNGVGQFRVVGDGGTIDVLGALTVGSGVNGVGTLAFELEVGESLSTINVVGSATFAAGSSLIFDASQAAPGQLEYDLLTAASIVDNGLVFSGLPGWNYRIVNVGSGDVLQAFVPEPGSLSLTLIASVMFLRRRR